MIINLIKWSLFDTISLPGAPSADRVDGDVNFDADFLLPGALMSDGGHVITVDLSGVVPVFALLGDDTDGEVDDVSTTTEGGGGSVDDVSTTTERGGGSVG